MRKSIFDSNTEQKILKRLKTYWINYVDVYPQIPIKNILGFDDIMGLNMKNKAKEYLLKTSIDFVVCELNNGKPILAIEFDGLSGGFSSAGEFIMKSIPDSDKYRKLKMETKLKACEILQFPIVIISYQECELLRESNEMITLLDIIIGDALEKLNYQKNYSNYNQMISSAFEHGGKESAELATIEIDIINEQCNPIKRKIKNITKNFPFWTTQIIFPETKGDELQGRFYLHYGLLTKNNIIYTKKLLFVDISIRQVNTYKSDSLFLFNTIGEYCLAKKAEKMLGKNKVKWEELIEKTEWTR
jgi:hypothetical protein